MKPSIRSYESLVKELTQAKVAHVAGVPSASEKDPADKGTVTPPTDPDSNPAKQQVPTKEHKNADETPTLTPPSLAKTVNGDEKVASALKQRVAALQSGLKNLLGKSAAEAKKTEGIMGQAAPPNPHDNKGGTQAPAPQSSGPKGDPIANTPTKSAEMSKEGEKDPTQKAAPAPTGDAKGQLPSDPKNTDETGGSDTKAKMANEQVEFDPSFHFKLASLVLNCEEGRRLAEDLLQKEHGMQIADDIIKAATFMEELAQQAAQAEAAGAAEAEALLKNASAEDLEMIQKIASFHAETRETLTSELEKEAYDAGASAAAEMADAGLMGPEMPPEAAGDQITPEDIAAVLDEMVQSGQVPPDIAAQIMAALSGGGDPAAAGGAPGAGAPPMDPAAAAGAGAPPMDPAAAAGAAAPAPAAPAPGGPPAAAGGGGGGGEKEKSAPKKEEGGEKKEGEKKEASATVKLASAALELAFK